MTSDRKRRIEAQPNPRSKMARRATPARPPDYISIPKRLRSEPVAVLCRYSRLRGFMACANVRRFGDLHGKRLSDFEAYAESAGASLWELRGFILRALHSGVEPDRATWPMPMGDYRPPWPVLEVSPALDAFSPLDLPMSARLEHALRRLGIARLGQLHGLPMRTVLRTRNAGSHTLEELKTVLRRAEAGEFGLPEKSRASKRQATPQPPDSTIEVPATAEDLRLEDLPVSVRLEKLLRALGVERLGQLRDLSMREVAAGGNCGAKTLVELKTLLRRAEAGEFMFCRKQLASSTPGDLIRLIDQVVTRLPKRQRAFLLMRFGASGQEPLSLRQIGQQYGVTGEGVRQHIARTLDRIRRDGSGRLRQLLALLESSCCGPGRGLSSALVKACHDAACSLQHGLQFYARLIPRVERSEASEAPTRSSG